MKSFRLALSFTLFFLTSSIAFGEARCPGNVAPVQYYSLPHSHIGISVTLNGSGPYEFMVDTGAQITVIDPDLARELKLEAAGSLHVATVASNVEVPLVTVAIVAVGPVDVEQLPVAVEDLGRVQSEYASLRGILGNNFLSRFDLLIDNSHKLLCLDALRQMQNSLRGDRVPMLSRADCDPGSGCAQAILLLVHLPDDGPKGSVLRLDSGSNVPLLFVDPQARARTRPQMMPVSGTTIGKQAQILYAFTPARLVRLGAHKEMEIVFAAPTGRLYSKPAEDGILPTTIFHEVFISFADHFVMFDPR
jgi:hypothetical protein